MLNNNDAPKIQVRVPIGSGVPSEYIRRKNGEGNSQVAENEKVEWKSCKIP